MQKYIYTLLAVLFVFKLAAQEVAPPFDANFKQLTTSQFYLHLPDSTIWQYKGINYGWARLARYKEVDQKLDNASKNFSCTYFNLLTDSDYTFGVIGANNWLKISEDLDTTSTGGRTITFPDPVMNVGKVIHISYRGTPELQKWTFLVHGNHSVLDIYDGVFYKGFDHTLGIPVWTFVSDGENWICLNRGAIYFS